MKLFELRMSKPKVVKPESVRLVVVESGASRFESRVPPDDGDETIVVAQNEGELPASLVTRVASRISAIEGSRRTIGRAIVLVEGRHDAQASGARWLMARALLSHLLLGGGSELVLDADGATADLRHQLLSLVESLLEEFEQSSVPVRLQFRRDPPVSRPSGVYPIPSANPGADRSTGSARS